MNLSFVSDSPFQISFSFYPLIDELEIIAGNSDDERSAGAKQLLNDITPYPELRDGITDTDQVLNNQELISRLLANIFPHELTLNEIKAVTIPYFRLILNHTQRFKNILEAAGPDFEFNIRNFEEHQMYIFSCCLILNAFYNTKVDFNKPLFYDIPAANGIMKHYRILYNADFLDIFKTENSLNLTPEDIDLLLNNYDDLELWKQKFPPQSYIVKGFSIMTLVDVTVDNAVSTLKEKLLNPAKVNNLQGDLQEIFRSIFGIADLQIGMISYDKEEKKFSKATFAPNAKTFIFNDGNEIDCNKMLGPDPAKKLVDKEQFFAVSDTKNMLLQKPDSQLLKHFLDQGIHSFILAPVINSGELLGVLEIVSFTSRELNSVNAHKLEVVMPFISDAIARRIGDYQNQIQAVIQNEYTTLHPSVQWKFRDEAKKFIQSRMNSAEYILQEIVFQDVYPLYGQIDIKGSSDARNLSIQKDMYAQLQFIQGILLKLQEKGIELTYQLERTQEYIMSLSNFSVAVKTDIEQYVQHFIDKDLYPVLKQAAYSASDIAAEAETYFKHLDKLTGDFYQYRRMYDTTVSVINQKLSLLLDQRQQDAQQIFPHYYERFKTDGVEHNLYIGPSIAPNREFKTEYYHQLRLWQIQVLCEMEAYHHSFKSKLPYQLEVTTLILAFDTSLSIRFRMDEKHFDVDGTYNARFAMIKKRIDKAHIKDKWERIVEVGKITIVYASKTEEREYLGYIKTLQENNLLDAVIERLDVEELPGVAGLKALRIKILH
jgi:hypothetical protein